MTDESEYVAPGCTVFRLKKDKVKHLIVKGFKMTDHYKDEEGYDWETLGF